VEEKAEGNGPAVSDLECTVCGQPASVHTVTTPIVAEPEAAKVIVVVEAPAGDRSPVERRYPANRWNLNDDGLTIHRDPATVARYNDHAWLSVRFDGALVPDTTVRALGIAKRALEAVTRISDPNVAIQLATDALGEIFAETE
jgi:hypothetical protein